MTTPVRSFWWAADHAGPGFYRMGLPAAALRDIGWDAPCSTLLPDEVRTDHDVVVVGQRVCQVGPSQMWQEFAADGRTVVLELDDDLFAVDASSPVAHRFFTREVLHRLSENLRVSTAVLVSTAPLAAVVGEHTDAPVHVLPNCLPEYAFNLPVVAPDDCVVVGYPGSSTHAMDVEYAGRGLRRFFTRSSALLHTMGHDYGREIGAPAERHRHTPWVDGVDGYWREIDFHVGIAPLRPHRFNQSKSALKVLELGARGIPVVASDTGPYTAYVEHGVDGFLVRRDHEWARYLRLLVDDVDARREVGAAARLKALGFVLEDRVHDWARALSAAADRSLVAA